MLKKPSKKAIQLIGATLLSSCSVSEVLAQVYKWVDENGQIHYSDKKPQEKAKVSTLKIKTHSSKAATHKSGSSSAPNTPEREAELQKKAQSLSTASSSKEGKLSESKCAAMKENLRKIQDSPRLRINDGGQMRFLTPQEIEERKATYTANIEKHC